VCGPIAENAAWGAERVSAEFKPDHWLAARAILQSPSPPWNAAGRENKPAAEARNCNGLAKQVIEPFSP